MDKIISYKNLSHAITQIRKPITLIGGCFDIIHPGHIEFLKRAKSLGGSTVILLESDKSVQQRKGQNRPIYHQKERAKILCAFTYVDLVIMIPYMSTDEQYFKLVKKIKPGIIAITKGDELKKVKQRQAKIVNAKLIEIMNRDPKYSTSTVISKAQKSTT